MPVTAPPSPHCLRSSVFGGVYYYHNLTTTAAILNNVWAMYVAAIVGRVVASCSDIQDAGLGESGVWDVGLATVCAVGAPVGQATSSHPLRSSKKLSIIITWFGPW